MSQTGKGTAATVYEAYYQNSKTPIALKVINLETTQQSLEQVQREIKTLYNCHYKTITPLYKAFVQHTYLILVMKEMKLSLQDILTKLCPTGLSEQCIAIVMKDVLQALVYLHQNNQIHRDIKLSNLLLDEEGITYLSDFGVSGFIDQNSSMKKNTFCGTVLTIAPEVANFKPYDQKADVWSFCICCYQLLTGGLPYETLSSMEALEQIRKMPPPKLPNNRNISTDFRQVLEAGLQTDPEKRLTAQQILNMRFFKQQYSRRMIQDIIKQYLLVNPQKMNDNYSEEIEQMNQILQGGNSNNKTNSDWDFSYDVIDKERSQSQIIGYQDEQYSKQHVDLENYLFNTNQLIQEVKMLRKENQQLKQQIQQLLNGK